MSSIAINPDGIIRRSEADDAREEAFLPTHVAQAHASFLLALGNGDIACTWFAGTEEGKPDVSIYFSRLPAGSRQWTPETKVSDDPERSEQNPVLFETPEGALWLLYTAQEFGNQDTAIVRRRISQDGGRSWGPIETLFDEPGTFIRQPMLVLSSGEWILPIFHCLPVPGETWHGQNDVSAVKISADQGRTWSEYPVPESRGAVHMNIVERRDGTLLALFRSRYADSIMSATSGDKGRTWTTPVPTPLPNNNSSIQCRALADGTLALVFNNVSATPAVRAQAQGRPTWGVPRTPLSIALSSDEGETWPVIRDIEVAPSPPPELNVDKQDRRMRELSYPTVTGDAQGRINVAFTYFRKAIKFVRFNPGWVAGA
ncbi:sialidase family protein [Chelativorans sp. AA-79]|uniref:sialidase family protein n=1 Tax=Chelativorans sp. AA-79 TaxID=3028735 RepID=UPI0023F8C6B1|nr:sialidase family protein [Chelativorans sp. AA-79]WEX11273.1 exo-alpha-sialidase [Chelativorans sp. AA-79]